MKTHLTFCFQDWNADASHTQNLAKCRVATTARLWNSRSLYRAYATTAFRQGLCKRPSLHVRDALPFDRLMRNFKRHFVCYEDKRRNFDRIELWRSPRRKGENSKRGRCSHADSVETLRMRSICVPLKNLQEPKLHHFHHPATTSTSRPRRRRQRLLKLGIAKGAARLHQSRISLGSNRPYGFA